MSAAAPAAGFRPAGPADLTAIAALLSGVYPEFAAHPDFARAYLGWKYFDREGRMTPYASAMLAEDSRGLVGLIGCLPFRLRRGSHGWDAGWIADWHLAPRARGVGVGRALLQEAVRAVPVLACINGSEEAERLYRLFDFREFPCGRSFLRVRRPLAFEWPRRRGPRRALALARSLEHAFRRKPSGMRSKTALGRSVSASEAAELSGRPDGPVHDAGFLGWILRSPAGAIDLRAVTAGGRDVGVAALWCDEDTLGRRRGRILDLSLMDPSEELLGAAFAAAAAQLEAAGADYVDARAPVRLEPALSRAGMRPRRLDRLWLRSDLAVLPGPGPYDWSISLMDKDDAFRGSRRIP